MKWVINQLETMNIDKEQNVVVISRFTISDTQNGLSGAVSYGVQLLPPAPGQPFTPYDQITQDQALAWTKEALGPDRVLAMEAEVQAIIDQQKIPTPQPQPLPWASGN
jgi:hypothetical protein